MPSFVIETSARVRRAPGHMGRDPRNALRAASVSGLPEFVFSPSAVQPGPFRHKTTTRITTAPPPPPITLDPSDDSRFLLLLSAQSSRPGVPGDGVLVELELAGGAG
eukprot:7859962-Pyramimonas_sp.AAC.1